MVSKLNEFYDLLERFDWTYSYSDDHRAWLAGEEQSKVIQEWLEENPELLPLYEAYKDYVYNWQSGVEKPERPNGSS